MPDEPKHRSFLLTPESGEHRSFVLTSDVGYRVARGALALYVVTFLLGLLVMCACPGVYVLMAVCAVVAFASGSRRHRFLSAGLFILAIAGVIHEVRAEQRMHERLRGIQEKIEQKGQSPTDPKRPEAN